MMDAREEPTEDADTGADEPATTGAAADELEISFPTLAARSQVTPLPVPLQNPALLPLSDLDPEVLERLVAEIVSRQDNRGVQFYGRRGQKQYGLDVVEREKTGTRSLYQVKRYQQVDPKGIREAVEEYAGPARGADFDGIPRRFDPRRFVVVTSALLDVETGNVDEIDRLQGGYDGDLEIEVWGAEALSRKLRDAPNLVYAVFGAAWAKAFCGFEPAPARVGAPRPLALVEEPTEVLGLASMVADAEQLEQTDPAAAARLYMTVSAELEGHNFPGHAVLMRRRQAEAARLSGDTRQAFEVSWRLAMEQVRRGERHLHVGPNGLDDLVAQLSPAEQAKWTVLQSIAAWYEHGVDLVATVPELGVVVEADDPDAGVLCCLVLEQVVVDGLQEHDPPYAVVGEPDPGTSRLLADLVALTERCDSSDPILRARLRCAVADASLSASATPAEVNDAFGKLLDDALAGRYLHGRGIVASRAAYQFATHGDGERAENLWRQSVLGASEAELYGDVRNALRAIRLIHSDSGLIEVIGLDVVVSALPNRRRLIAGSTNAFLNALEAAQSGKVVEAFGSSRRDIWEARVAGQLLEELLALRLFGDVLLAAERPTEAVECYVLAGESKKAVEAAKSLTTRVDVDRWLSSPLRRRCAAAVKTLAAQARLIPDADVSSVVRTMLDLAAAAWQAPRVGPAPEHAAIEAVAAFGERIPPEAVDPLLELAAPAREHNTGLSDVIARVLVTTYWAVPDRRDDLAAALVDMLQLAQPPHNLWEILGRLPAAAREPLLEIVRTLAADDNAQAVEALSDWGDGSPVVQLAARRACAALLRRPVGGEHATSVVGTQEVATVQLLKCLLRAEDATVVDAADLVPSLSRPAGGVLFISTVVDEGADESAGASSQAAGEGEVGDAIDDTARVAAGSREDLAVAVARKLLDLAMDTRQIAAPRTNAIDALRRLLPDLPASVAAELAPELLKLHHAPSLSERDEREIESDVPLSRMRINTGARSLAPRALVAAAEAFTGGRDTAEPASVEEAAFATQIMASAMSLLQTGDNLAISGALAVSAVASASPTFRHHATALLFHPVARVRALGAAQAPVGDAMFARLVTDGSPIVRRAVAARCDELSQDLRRALAEDPDAIVRETLASRLRTSSIEQSGGVDT